MPYRIQRTDVPRAAEVLSASFFDYPIFVYLIPDAVKRRRRLTQVFGFLVRLGLAHGEVLAPSERIEGVSVWYRSEHAHSSPLMALRAGLLGLFLRLGPSGAWRLIRVSALKSRARIRLLSGPYCLLDMIGIDPSLQGQGLARTMIETKLLELDRERVPCYLETSRREMASYYQRFGFEMVHEYRLATMDVFCLLRKIGACA